MIPATGLGRAASRVGTTERLVAIGTSTGGTQALEAVLRRLPATTPGIVIVQHMPERFTAMFAERLNSLCEIEVREARHGDRVISGLALIILLLACINYMNLTTARATLRALAPSDTPPKERAKTCLKQ